MVGIMGMHNYRELKIWQRSMEFVVRVYEISGEFPKDEKFGLTAQLRRSCISVPSNIAEGAGRGTNNQFKRFLEVAMGSINEAQTQLELAFRVHYIPVDIHKSISDEAMQIYKMVLAFYNSLKNDED